MFVVLLVKSNKIQSAQSSSFTTMIGDDIYLEQQSAKLSCANRRYTKYVMLHIKLQPPPVLLLRAAHKNLEVAAISQNVRRTSDRQ